MIVLLLDEIDMLVTKDQSILYNFFDWPRLTGAKLIVIAISNTLDLPERFDKKALPLSSPLPLTFMIFLPFFSRLPRVSV